MKKIILVALVLLSGKLMAYNVAAGKIGTINTNPNSALIELANGNEDGCSHAAAAGNLVLPITAETKAQYSALLSAAVSGKTVRVLYSGCLSDLPQIIRVDLLN